MTMVPIRTAFARVRTGLFGLLSSARGGRWSRDRESSAAPRLTGGTWPSGLAAGTASRTEGRGSDAMPASLDLVAEQMLTLVDIVSAQEKELQSLRLRCQTLEEHEQAIMVAFTTFFHVLAAGKVAKIDDISAILENITGIAEREERPREAIKFLNDLAAMLRDQSPRGEQDQDFGRPEAGG